MIQIQEPQLEALIMERLRAGSFENVEQALMDALIQAPPPRQSPCADTAPTGAEIIAAFQRCPVKDFSFGSEPIYSPISDPVRF